MRLFCLILCLILVKGIVAQVINPFFDVWEVIQIGEPYENPVGWITNNETDKNGLASTPVTKGVDSLGYYARVASNAHGIDATLSGLLAQTISVENLIKIEFDSRCDTLSMSGRCIVRVLDESKNNVLFVDTTSTESNEFSRSVIEIESDWTQENDSLTIQFIAKGGHDPWDEEEDGYSVYMIDNVSAEYITGVEEVEQELEIDIYPNPANDRIHLLHKQTKEPSLIEILTLMGQTVLKAKFSNEINLSTISSGTYILRLVSEEFIQSKILIIDNVN